MASSPELVAYVAEQLGGEAAGVATKKMFGEYALYLRGKLVVLICDDMVFLKPTQAGRELLVARGCLKEAPPYEGAKNSFLIENVDDAAFLRELAEAGWEELPFPKPRKGKQGK